MKKIYKKFLGKFGLAIDELSIIVYLLYLVDFDLQNKIVKENQFCFTNSEARKYLNDLLRKKVIEFENMYSDF